MTQGNLTTRTEPYAIAAARGEEPDLVSLSSMLAFLRRSASLILGTAIIVLSVGIVYVAMTPPGYVAHAELLIESQKQPFFWNQAGIIDLTVDNAQVESQLEVLRSERIASVVINKLQLTEDPEFVSIGPSNDFERSRAAIGSFMSRANARRIGQSYMIEVSFRSNDAEKAAKIVNTITAAYLQDNLQAKIDAAKEANTWAERRITEVGVRLNSAAAEVQKFKADHGIVDATSTQSLYINTLTELEARVQSYRKLYESFLEKLTQNAEQESFPSSAARVISGATTPLAKNFPKTGLILSFSLLLGMLLGFALAFVREMIDYSINSPKQFFRTFGMECFGVLPKHRKLVNRAWLFEAPAHDPQSPFVTGLQGIKVAIQLVARSRSLKVIGVTSAGAGEGKSTVAASLASLYAIAGRPPLLIDADFRHASISRDLAPDAKVHLPQLLEGPVQSQADTSVSGEVRRSTGLRIISAGAVGYRPVGSADTLSSSEMGALLEQLKVNYPLIIIDLPGLDTAPDARAIGPYLDACVLVAEYGKTQIDAFQDVVNAMAICDIPVLGGVINKANSNPFQLSLNFSLQNIRTAAKRYWPRGRKKMNPAAVGSPYETTSGKFPH